MAVPLLSVRIFGIHVTPEPGWYPDPADPQHLRWWNGTEWTAHVGPPVVQTTARRPLIGRDQAVGNPFIWLIACLPAGWGLYIIAGVAKTLPFMQSVFSQLGYPT
jgi:hypothetical protein